MFLVFVKEPKYILNHRQYEVKTRQHYSDICWAYAKIAPTLATICFIQYTF